jgi:hypothetical protein
MCDRPHSSLLVELDGTISNSMMFLWSTALLALLAVVVSSQAVPIAGPTAIEIAPVPQIQLPGLGSLGSLAPAPGLYGTPVLLLFTTRPEFQDRSIALSTQSGV